MLETVCVQVLFALFKAYPDGQEYVVVGTIDPPPPIPLLLQMLVLRVYPLGHVYVAVAGMVAGVVGVVGVVGTVGGVVVTGVGVTGAVGTVGVIPALGEHVFPEAFRVYPLGHE
jgi:hypothetical protein